MIVLVILMAIFTAGLLYALKIKRVWPLVVGFAVMQSLAIPVLIAGELFIRAFGYPANPPWWFLSLPPL